MSDVSGPPPAASPPPAGRAGLTSTAGLGPRFGARLLDGLIVGIPTGLVLGMLGISASGFGMRGWLGNTIFSLLWFGYYVYFESTAGATLGKRILKLRVVTADGSSPSFEAAAKRNVWMLFGIVPLIGGIVQFIAVIVVAVTISSDPANRGKHDEFAGTGVMV